jgi:hypothetical protein
VLGDRLLPAERELLHLPPGMPARVGGMVPPVLVQAHILHHRAAAGDVQNLHTAADAEDRQAARDRGGGKGELELVALGLGRGQQRVRLLPVSAGIDVAARGQQDRVKPPEHRLDRLE